MKLSAEICSVKLQKRTCRILTTINFVLLIATIGSPLFLWYTFQYGYFLRGVWTVCDHLGCSELLETGVYLNAAQAFSVMAGFAGFIALLSTWGLLTHLITCPMSENLVSFVANLHTGIFLLVTLVIIALKLRTEVDIEGNRLKLFVGFYLGCFVCLLSFVLGMQNILQHKALVEEKQDEGENPEDA